MEEHEDSLCPLSMVPCINREFGCGLMLLRRDLATHLPSCPANIITCTQEWNRWPLHCRDRWKTVPFRNKNPMAERGQLDYELALRDQRMVGDFYKVQRKTKLAKRNKLLMDDSDEETEDWTQCCQVVECQWQCGAS